MSLQLGVPLLLVASILQAVLLPRLRVLGGQPDLVLLLVLAWCILDKRGEGVVWAFVGGLFLDLFSGAPLGISSLAMVPVAFFVSQVEAQLYRESLVLPVVVAMVGALGFHVLTMVFLRFLADVPMAWTATFTYVTLPSMLFDVILIVPVLQVLSPWHDRLHPRVIRF